LKKFPNFRKIKGLKKRFTWISGESPEKMFFRLESFSRLKRLRKHSLKTVLLPV